MKARLYLIFFVLFTGGCTSDRDKVDQAFWEYQGCISGCNGFPGKDTDKFKCLDACAERIGWQGYGKPLKK